MKFLVDENLSPALVHQLAQRGYAAAHVAHLGRAAMSDPELWRFAFERDEVIVTTNYGDFLQLAAASEVHAGLIVFRRGGLTREEQWAWLAAVLDSFGAQEALVNEVIEVTALRKFSRRALPP